MRLNFFHFLICLTTMLPSTGFSEPSKNNCRVIYEDRIDKNYAKLGWIFAGPGTGAIVPMVVFSLPCFTPLVTGFVAFQVYASKLMREEKILVLLGGKAKYIIHWLPDLHLRKNRKMYDPIVDKNYSKEEELLTDFSYEKVLSQVVDRVIPEILDPQLAANPNEVRVRIERIIAQENENGALCKNQKMEGYHQFIRHLIHRG